MVAGEDADEQPKFEYHVMSVTHSAQSRQGQHLAETIASVFLTALDAAEAWLHTL
jgi:hypothetical protein